MKKVISVLLVIVMLCSSFAGLDLSALFPVAHAATGASDIHEFNGHYYKVFDIGYEWQDAQSKCVEMGGHLVTITSEEEQEFIQGILKNGTRNFYWLGAQKIGDLRNNVFIWVTFEKWEYDHGKYNNYSRFGGEDSLMIYRLNNPLAYEYAYDWNDLYHDGTCGSESFFGLSNSGFICEWDGQYAITKCTISGITNKTYTGKAISQSITVKYGKTILKKGTDYTLTYKNNKKVGTATITITGKGYYTGTLKKSFKILRKKSPAPTSISSLTGYPGAITVRIKKQTKDVNGYNIQIATDKSFKNVVLKATTAKTTHTTRTVLKLNQKYFVRVRTCGKNPDKTFYSKYSAVKSVYTMLKPPTSLKAANDTKNPSATTLKLTWNKVSGAKGYDIYRATSKNGKYAKIKTIGKGTTVSYVDKNLKATKQYYYRIKALSNKHSSANSIISTTVTGCKTKYPINYAIISALSEEYNYGKGVVPKTIVINTRGKKLKNGTDYTLKYSNNANVGKNAVVTVTGKGDFYGSESCKFSITPKKLAAADVAVSGVQLKNGIYYPTAVKISAKNITLKEKTDFTFGSVKKVNEQNNKVTITFKGNYSGSVVKTYPIYTYEMAYKRFIKDDRWKNGIEWGGSQKQKISKHESWGCCAYAADFTRFMYNYTGWSKDKYTSAAEIRAGDVIHYNNGTAGHWFVVLARDGNSLYTAEGNFGYNSPHVRITKTGYTIIGDNIYNTAVDKEYSLYYGYHFKFTGYYYSD